MAIDVKRVFQALFNVDFPAEPVPAESLYLRILEAGEVIVTNRNISHAEQYAAHLRWLDHSCLQVNVALVLQSGTFHYAVAGDGERPRLYLLSGLCRKYDG